MHASYLTAVDTRSRCYRVSTVVVARAACSNYAEKVYIVFFHSPSSPARTHNMDARFKLYFRKYFTSAERARRTLPRSRVDFPYVTFTWFLVWSWLTQPPMGKQSKIVATFARFCLDLGLNTPRLRGLQIYTQHC